MFTETTAPRLRARRALTPKREAALLALDVEPVPCMVPGCKGQIEQAGLTCGTCWDKLPEGARYTLSRIQTQTPALRSRSLAVIGVALARLAAELAGPLTSDELAEAEQLNPLCHGGFDSFAALITAESGYFPKLYANDRADLTPSERIQMSRFADLYDRAQASRGDFRRAIRLGHSGL